MGQTTRGNNVYGPNQLPEKLIPKFMLLGMKGNALPMHGDGSNVRTYLYYEDVAEAFEVILHRGEVGHVYNIETKKERRVIDVARDICNLFSLDRDTHIKFVKNRPFNEQRYYLDDQKLKNLGWFERTTWEEGLTRTMELYVKNPDWWGDVSGALLPHPRMLTMPGFEKNFKGSDLKKSASSVAVNNSSQNRMAVPTPRDNLSTQKPSLKFLIYGGAGSIGTVLGKICQTQGIAFEYGKRRLEETSQLLKDIETIKPTHVFNASGATGAPNVKWVEAHKPETIRSNVVGVLTLADVCKEHGLLMINYAISDNFEDGPNSTGSSYSKIHAMVEQLLKDYDNVCTLRIQLPVSSDLSNPHNFITKIARFDKVARIPVSLTVLDELLPISVEMAKRNCRGLWNFTNPGIVTLNEILEMYKNYVDHNFKWVNFTLQEQANASLSSQSFQEKDALKLKNEFPELLPIKDSLIKYVFQPMI